MQDRVLGQFSVFYGSNAEQSPGLGYTGYPTCGQPRNCRTGVARDLFVR